MHNQRKRKTTRDMTQRAAFAELMEVGVIVGKSNKGPSWVRGQRHRPMGIVQGPNQPDSIQQQEVGMLA